MNETSETFEASEVKINKKRELPLVWLLPVCALIVSAWLIYKSISDKGPVITITFPSANGLEVDKTKIKYLDVNIGKVTTITINDDLKSINLTAQMDKDTDNLLGKDTQFWVVRPQIGLGGVSGLDTLLSGAYIAMKPGRDKKGDNFTGLKDPPLLQVTAEGRHYNLKATAIGSMRAGTPIFFHGIQVGEAINYQLAEDADSIKLSIFIYSPYDKFIRKETRFWVDSGIDFSTNTNGFTLRTGPLLSLLSGGIAFRTDEDGKDNDIQPEYTTFQLFENYEQSTQVIYRKTVRVVMFFDNTVKGLAIGAPVMIRGMPIGKVTDIKLELDEKAAVFRIPVIVEVEPDRINKVNVVSTEYVKEGITRLIAGGLRAQLQSGNLLTGQLFVALDMFPDTKVVKHVNTTGLPEFPTVPTQLDQITHSAQVVMDKLSKLPMDKIAIETEKTLVDLQATTKAATSALNSATGTLRSLDGTLSNANGTLSSADKTLNSARQVLSTLEPGSTTQYQLNRLLQELNRSLNSVNQLTDYLERNPSTLIRGKQENNK
jgi:paraquat-inducible protein B